MYNIRVADYHTYFVGDIDWGFSVWVHNADCQVDLAYNLRKNPQHGVATDTIAEHVPQTKWARDLIPTHNSINSVGREPAIIVSVSEAETITRAELNTIVPASAREALAIKLRILREHTNAPKSAIQKLVQLSKELHPWDYLPITRMELP